MDYILEVRLWNLGFDEADELALAIADLCAERKLGATKKGDSEVRSLVTLKNVPAGLLDCSSPERLERMMRRATRGARTVIVPREGKSIKSRMR